MCYHNTPIRIARIYSLHMPSAGKQRQINDAGGHLEQ